MAESHLLILKESIFSKKKTLIINPEFLAFGTNSFSKFEIVDIRYGIKAIEGYRFRIGRVYCIDVKSITGSIFKIRLISVYRIGKNKLGKKYGLILHALFDNYINDISRDFIAKFRNKIDFNLLDIAFTQEGITINKSNKIIFWSDVGTKDYWTYYSIFSSTDPNKYRTFQYLYDWNTVVLYSVLEHILKVKTETSS
jgi:hypothetical protein